jgi:hypothetical protein
VWFVDIVGEEGVGQTPDDEIFLALGDVFGAEICFDSVDDDVAVSPSFVVL